MVADDMRRGANTDDQDDQDGGAKRFIVPIVLTLALAGLGYFIYTQVGKGGSGGAKRQTVKIAVLPDTPPPPPPPPKEEKKPEPKLDENKPQAQEQPKPDATPEPQQLKMEGAAGDGPSAFGSGTVNNEYKGGPIGSGAGGTVGERLAAMSYGNASKRELNEFLNREADVRRAGDYKVPIGLWVRADGSVERLELLQSSGNTDTDELLRKALSRFRGFKNPPPPGMAWPMRLQLTNRLTG